MTVFERKTKSAFVGLAVASGAMVAASAASIAFEPETPEPPAQAALIVPSPSRDRAQSGETANASHMRALVSNIWNDVNAVWQTMPAMGMGRGPVPHLNLVPKVSAAHCYGIYISSGPVYCTGNGTVFASLDELMRLANRLGAKADAGLAFLIAHEFGHHIQLVNGRFGIVRHKILEEPSRQREISLRFELEADCLAGVWAARSRTFAAGETTRSDIVASLDLMGDDTVQVAAFGAADPSTFWHGTSVQRAHWFMTGLHASDDLEACSALTADRF